MLKRVTIRKVLLIMSMLWVFSPSVWAADSVLDQIIDRGYIRVGTTGDYAPFSYVNESKPDEYLGVDIELAKNLAQALGVEVKFVYTTWPALMDDLLANKFDIAMSGISISLERQKKAFFSVPVRSGGKAAITRDENVHKYRTIEDINKPEVRVVVNPGGTNEIFTRTNFPNAQIILNKDNLSVHERIVNGDADLMVTDVAETLSQQEIRPELEAVNPDNPFVVFDKGFLMNRDYIFKAFVDQWVRHLKIDDIPQKLFESELKKIAVNHKQK